MICNPQTGEKFQFGGTGTEYTIQSVTATGNTGEYQITIDTAVSTSDGTALQFTESETWYLSNSTPDTRGLTVYHIWNYRGGNINYYGSGTVGTDRYVVFDNVASALM